MKPANFRYERGETVAQVVDLLAAMPEESRVLAGGQTLVPLMVFRMAAPDVLIDITRVPELQALHDGDALVVGAAVTQAAVEDHTRMPGRFDALSDGLAHVAHRDIRNLGTVCGSLAHGDPTAELPAVALALNASLRLASTGGVRDVAADGFWTGPYDTACRDDELVTAVTFPDLGGHTASAFVEVADGRSGIAVAGVAAAVGTAPDGTVAWARLGLAGVAPTPVANDAAAVLAGQRLTDAAIADAAAQAAAGVDPPTDHRGHSRYRRQLVEILTQRALMRCRERLDGSTTRFEEVA